MLPDFVTNIFVSIVKSYMLHLHFVTQTEYIEEENLIQISLYPT